MVFITMPTAWSASPLLVSGTLPLLLHLLLNFLFAQLLQFRHLGQSGGLFLANAFSGIAHSIPVRLLRRLDVRCNISQLLASPSLRFLTLTQVRRTSQAFFMEPCSKRILLPPLVGLILGLARNAHCMLMPLLQLRQIARGVQHILVALDQARHSWGP